MKQKINKNAVLRLRLSVLLLLFCFAVHAQNPSGLSINWNIEVGCQTYSEDIKDPRKPIFIEEIGITDCIQVCEKTSVTYTLSGDLEANPQIVWTVTGGTIASGQGTPNCVVNWGAFGSGTISFTITLPGGAITKEICIDKIKIPVPNFSIVGLPLILPEDLTHKPRYYACTLQELFFTNTSSANGGSALVNYLWDFGDGSTTSPLFEPSHTYYNDGEYTVTLTVTNECGCKSVKRIQVIVKSKGFDIQCPAVVCEGQTVTYSLPFDGKELCKEAYKWNVSYGGHIDSVDPANGNVTVTWSDVESLGFGFLTFDPGECKLDCLIPTTIKVPVIKTIGSIVGPAVLCQGSQGTYTLPEWPGTDFSWQIVGDPNQTLADIILTDQRNKVVVTAMTSGTFILRATYENTLLHCGGTADFVIHVGKPNAIKGETLLCAGSSVEYTTFNGGNYDWVIKRNNSIVATSYDSVGIHYTFTTAGNYTVNIASTELCTNTSLGVTVYALPQTPSTVTGQVIVCPEAPYEYAVVNPDPNSTYRWEVLPSGSGDFAGSAVGNQVTVTFHGTGTHQLLVYRESTTPLKCSSVPKTVNISTRAINAAVVPDDNTSATVCSNSYGQYKVVKTSDSTLYTSGEIYNWSLVNANPTTIDAASLGSITTGQGTNKITVLWNNVTEMTTVNLHLEITECTLPVKTFDFEVIIVPTPTITIHVDDTSVCSGTSNFFTLTSDVSLSPLTPVIWNFGGVTVNSVLGNNVSYSFFSTFSNNILRTVTATITACEQTISATPVEMTIYPGPPASNSITAGGNSYCDEGLIDTVLTAGTSTGTTIQWFEASIPTPTALTGILNPITNPSYSPTGFGNYYFISTDTTSGCSTQSNVVSIYPCNPVPSCDVSNYPVTNNAEADCNGKILLNGSAPNSAYPMYWAILGPQISISNYTGTEIQAQAGVYHVFCVGTYPCPSGGYGLQKEYKEITIPYIPKFNYTATCMGNSTFTLKVNDNSNFFNPVTDRVYEYYLDSGSGYPITPNLTAADGTISTALGSGTYSLKLVVRGKLNGIWQTACERVITFTLSTLPTNMSINTVNAPVACHNTPVRFDINNNQNFAMNTYLWTFDNLAQNTLAQPSRVFTDSGDQPVSVVVTNKQGCTVTLNVQSPGVHIPPKCFTGTVTSNPTPAVECSGNSIALNYSSTTQNCSPMSYTWMNENTVLGTTTVPTYPMTNSGFYWVKVKSANNCIFETPNRITPLFKASPSVRLQTASSYCEGDGVMAVVDTNGTGIKWYLDGAEQTMYAGSAQVSFWGLNVGAHTIMVTASIDGCISSATQTVEVFAKPATPVLSSTLISCNPFEYKIWVTSGDGNYTWSNGATGGDSINVTHGGPYVVYSTVGGCRSISETINIPKDPGNYSWTVPSGCLVNCEKETVGTLIGPSVPLTYWAWLLNGAQQLSGSDSIPEPYPLTSSGVYNFVYQIGECTVMGAPLDYTMVGCEKCNFKDVELKDAIRNETKYCSFTVSIAITNDSPIPLNVTLTSPDDRVVIQPASFVLPPGSGTYFFTFVPINGFLGGSVDLLLTSTLEGKPCNFPFKISLPECGDQYISKTTAATVMNDALMVYPNPARDSVFIQFNTTVADAALAIYDLTGRIVSRYETTTVEGEWEVPLHSFASGVYIVVLEKQGQIVLQKKLIKE